VPTHVYRADLLLLPSQSRNTYDTTYGWLLPCHLRDRSLFYVGSNERLRNKMAQLAAGENLTIAAVGASITAGQGAHPNLSNIWLYRLSDMLQVGRPMWTCSLEC
jgi:hypothetical protein